jgi:hypothetical protein
MTEPTLEELVAEIVADRKLTRDELKRFEAKMLADGQLSVTERRCIDELLNLIASGKLQIVD